MAILEDMSQVQAELALLRAENERLKAKAIAKSASRLNFKVSAKGAVSIYGLGRFPITLYLSQFESLDKAWSLLQDFVVDNRHKLATKD